jgi:peptidase E
MVSSQIFAMGGGGFSMEPENPLLDDHLLSLVDSGRTPRVCFVPTASGDSEGYIARFMDAFGPDRAEASVLTLFKRTVQDLHAFVMSQDIIYVGGGNTANLLAIWRVHGLDVVLKEAYQSGVIMAGVSAGMNCWFEASVTDSFEADGCGPLPDGIGLIPGSACPHYDGEALRRPRYRELVDAGFPEGIAADDGVGLHYVGTDLQEVVTCRPDTAAYRVTRAGEERLEAHLIRR